MDDPLCILIARLDRIHARLGETAYHRAVHGALLAVAAAVLKEAEMAARRRRPDRTGNVISFPASGKPERPWPPADGNSR